MRDVRKERLPGSMQVCTTEARLHGTPARTRARGNREHAGAASTVPDRGIPGSVALQAVGGTPHYSLASLAADGGAVGSGLSSSTGTVGLAQGTSRFVVSSGHRSAFELGIQPLLGMADTGGVLETGGAWKETLDLLYSEGQKFTLFESYRRYVHPFHSIPFDLDDMEKSFCLLINLQESYEAQSVTEPAQEPRWLCLLNAILAAGAQASDLPLKHRLSLSRHHSQ